MADTPDATSDTPTPDTPTDDIDIDGLTDEIEGLTVEETNPKVEKDDLIRALMLETVDAMIKAKFKQHNLNPDSEDLNQVFSLIYRECCPERVRVEPKNLLYEEAIVKDILNRIQFA